MKWLAFHASSFRTYLDGARRLHSSQTRRMSPSRIALTQMVMSHQPWGVLDVYFGLVSLKTRRPHKIDFSCQSSSWSPRQLLALFHAASVCGSTSGGGEQRLAAVGGGGQRVRAHGLLRLSAPQADGLAAFEVRHEVGLRVADAHHGAVELLLGVVRGGVPLLVRGVRRAVGVVACCRTAGCCAGLCARTGGILSGSTSARRPR